MKKKVIILLLVFVLILIPIVTATSSFTFKKDSNAEVKIPCFNSNLSLCSASTLCVITINYPDSTNLTKNQTMTYNENYYNYTISGSQLNVEGEYASIVSCSGEESGFTLFNFDVTFTGNLREDKSKIPTVLGFMVTILFFGAFGIISKMTSVRFFAFAMSLIELVYLVGFLYVFEAGGILANLLRINFYIVGILAFGIGLLSIVRHTIRSVDITNDGLENTKWEGKGKWQ